MNITLKNAFPAMQSAETDALMRTARSVQETEKEKRRTPLALLAATAALLLMGAVALAEGLGWRLLETLFREMDVSVLPGVETRTDLLRLENEYAVFTVREAVFDGYSGSVIVEIEAKDKGTMLAPSHARSLNGPAAEVFYDREDTGSMTMREYAQFHGFQQLLIVDVDFPTPPDSSMLSNTGYAAVWEFDGHRATALCTFSTRGADVVGNVLAWPVGFSAYPLVEVMPTSVEWHSNGYGELYSRTGMLTFPVEEPLWTRTAQIDDRVMLKAVRVRQVTLTGTRLGVYMTVEYNLSAYKRTSDNGWSNNNRYSFTLGDVDGNRLASGPHKGGDRYTATYPNSDDPSLRRHTYVRSFQAMETPPGTTELWLYVTNLETDRTERMLLVLSGE